MINRLSSEDARALLEECRIGRLGCIADGGPYVVPVSYIIHDDSIYVHSAPGRKIDALRANPRVCLQVDRMRGEYDWRSAIAFGQFEEITDVAKRRHISGQILERFPHLTPVESLPAAIRGNSIVLFRIRVEEVTGVAETYLR